MQMAARGRNMLWVTQLCVSKKHRHIGIKRLLEAIRRNEHDGGILSSPPFAMLSVGRFFGRGMEDVDLEMTKNRERSCDHVWWAMCGMRSPGVVCSRGWTR